MTDPYLSAISNAADELDKTLDAWADDAQIEQDIADGKRCGIHNGSFIPCQHCRTVAVLRKVEWVDMRKYKEQAYSCPDCNGHYPQHAPDCELNQLLSDLGD